MSHNVPLLNCLSSADQIVKWLLTYQREEMFAKTPTLFLDLDDKCLNNTHAIRGQIVHLSSPSTVYWIAASEISSRIDLKVSDSMLEYRQDSLLKWSSLRDTI